MSGHSKWASIKHKKGAADAKRGNLFTKLGREITVAARSGGGNPAFNAALRSAIAAAKGSNMPNDNINRAIKRGTGELEGVSYEEILYEGYGPSGVAIMVRTLTDNKNRTVADIRHLFSRFNGSLGEAGSVRHSFEKNGLLTLPKEAITEDKLMEIALDAGANDVRDDGEVWEVVTAPEDFHKVRDALEKAGLTFGSAEVSMIPTVTVPVNDAKPASSIMKLVEALEEHDDVQSVYANFDIPEEILKTLED